MSTTGLAPPFRMFCALIPLDMVQQAHSTNPTSQQTGCLRIADYCQRRQLTLGQYDSVANGITTVSSAPSIVLSALTQPMNATSSSAIRAASLDWTSMALSEIRAKLGTNAIPSDADLAIKRIPLESFTCAEPNQTNFTKRLFCGMSGNTIWFQLVCGRKDSADGIGQSVRCFLETSSAVEAIRTLSNVSSSSTSSSSSPTSATLLQSEDMWKRLVERKVVDPGASLYCLHQNDANLLVATRILDPLYIKCPLKLLTGLQSSTPTTAVTAESALRAAVQSMYAAGTRLASLNVPNPVYYAPLVTSGITPNSTAYGVQPNVSVASTLTVDDWVTTYFNQYSPQGFSSSVYNTTITSGGMGERPFTPNRYSHVQSHSHQRSGTDAMSATNARFESKLHSNDKRSRTWKSRSDSASDSNPAVDSAVSSTPLSSYVLLAATHVPSLSGVASTDVLKLPEWFFGRRTTPGMGDLSSGYGGMALWGYTSSSRFSSLAKSDALDTMDVDVDVDVDVDLDIHTRDHETVSKAARKRRNQTHPAIHDETSSPSDAHLNSDTDSLNSLKSRYAYFPTHEPGVRSRSRSRVHVHSLVRPHPLSSETTTNERHDSMRRLLQTAAVDTTSATADINTLLNANSNWFQRIYNTTEKQALLQQYYSASDTLCSGLLGACNSSQLACLATYPSGSTALKSGFQLPLYQADRSSFCQTLQPRSCRLPVGWSSPPAPDDPVVLFCNAGVGRPPHTVRCWYKESANQCTFTCAALNSQLYLAVNNVPASVLLSAMQTAPTDTDPEPACRILYERATALQNRDNARIFDNAYWDGIELDSTSGLSSSDGFMCYNGYDTRFVGDEAYDWVYNSSVARVKYMCYPKIVPPKPEYHFQCGAITLLCRLQFNTSRASPLFDCSRVVGPLWDPWYFEPARVRAVQAYVQALNRGSTNETWSDRTWENWQIVNDALAMTSKPNWNATASHPFGSDAAVHPMAPVPMIPVCPNVDERYPNLCMEVQATIKNVPFHIFQAEAHPMWTFEDQCVALRNLSLTQKTWKCNWPAGVQAGVYAQVYGFTLVDDPLPGRVCQLSHPAMMQLTQSKYQRPLLALDPQDVASTSEEDVENFIEWSCENPSLDPPLYDYYSWTTPSSKVKYPSKAAWITSCMIRDTTDAGSILRCKTQQTDAAVSRPEIVTPAAPTISSCTRVSAWNVFRLARRISLVQCWAWQYEYETTELLQSRDTPVFLSSFWNATTEMGRAFWGQFTNNKFNAFYIPCRSRSEWFLGNDNGFYVRYNMSNTPGPLSVIQTDGLATSIIDQYFDAMWLSPYPEDQYTNSKGQRVWRARRWPQSRKEAFFSAVNTTTSIRAWPTPTANRTNIFRDWIQLLRMQLCSLLARECKGMIQSWFCNTPYSTTLASLSDTIQNTLEDVGAVANAPSAAATINANGIATLTPPRGSNLSQFEPDTAVAPGKTWAATDMCWMPPKPVARYLPLFRCNNLPPQMINCTNVEFDGFDGRSGEQWLRCRSVSLGFWRPNPAAPWNNLTDPLEQIVQKLTLQKYGGALQGTDEMLRLECDVPRTLLENQIVYPSNADWSNAMNQWVLKQAPSVTEFLRRGSFGLAPNWTEIARTKRVWDTMDQPLACQYLQMACVIPQPAVCTTPLATLGTGAGTGTGTTSSSSSSSSATASGINSNPTASNLLSVMPQRCDRTGIQTCAAPGQSCLGYLCQVDYQQTGLSASTLASSAAGGSGSGNIVITSVGQESYVLSTSAIASLQSYLSLSTTISATSSSSLASAINSTDVQRIFSTLSSVGSALPDSTRQQLLQQVSGLSTDLQVILTRVLNQFGVCTFPPAIYNVTCHQNGGIVLRCERIMQVAKVGQTTSFQCTVDPGSLARAGSATQLSAFNCPVSSVIFSNITRLQTTLQQLGLSRPFSQLNETAAAQRKLLEIQTCAAIGQYCVEQDYASGSTTASSRSVQCKTVQTVIPSTNATALIEYVATPEAPFCTEPKTSSTAVQAIPITFECSDLAVVCYRAGLQLVCMSMPGTTQWRIQSRVQGIGSGKVVGQDSGLWQIGGLPVCTMPDALDLDDQWYANPDVRCRAIYERCDVTCLQPNAVTTVTDNPELSTNYQPLFCEDASLLERARYPICDGQPLRCTPLRNNANNARTDAQNTCELASGCVEWRNPQLYQLYLAEPDWGRNHRELLCTNTTVGTKAGPGGQYVANGGLWMQCQVSEPRLLSAGASLTDTCNNLLAQCKQSGGVFQCIDPFEATISKPFCTIQKDVYLLDQQCDCGLWWSDQTEGAERSIADTQTTAATAWLAGTARSDLFPPTEDASETAALLRWLLPSSVEYSPAASAFPTQYIPNVKGLFDRERNAIFAEAMQACESVGLIPNPFLWRAALVASGMASPSSFKPVYEKWWFQPPFSNSNPSFPAGPMALDRDTQALSEWGWQRWWCGRLSPWSAHAEVLHQLRGDALTNGIWSLALPAVAPQTAEWRALQQTVKDKVNSNQWSGDPWVVQDALFPPASWLDARRRSFPSLALYFRSWHVWQAANIVLTAFANSYTVDQVLPVALQWDPVCARLPGMRLIPCTQECPPQLIRVPAMTLLNDTRAGYAEYCCVNPLQCNDVADARNCRLQDHSPWIMASSSSDWKMYLPTARCSPSLFAHQAMFPIQGVDAPARQTTPKVWLQYNPWDPMWNDTSMVSGSSDTTSSVVDDGETWVDTIDDGSQYNGGTTLITGSSSTVSSSSSTSSSSITSTPRGETSLDVWKHQCRQHPSCHGFVLVPLPKDATVSGALDTFGYIQAMHPERLFRSKSAAAVNEYTYASLYNLCPTSSLRVGQPSDCIGKPIALRNGTQGCCKTFDVTDTSSICRGTAGSSSFASSGSTSSATSQAWGVQFLHRPPGWPLSTLRDRKWQDQAARNAYSQQNQEASHLHAVSDARVGWESTRMADAASTLSRARSLASEGLLPNRILSNGQPRPLDIQTQGWAAVLERTYGYTQCSDERLNWVWYLTKYPDVLSRVKARIQDHVIRRLDDRSPVIQAAVWETIRSMLEQPDWPRVLYMNAIDPNVYARSITEALSKAWNVLLTTSSNNATQAAPVWNANQPDVPVPSETLFQSFVKDESGKISRRLRTIRLLDDLTVESTLTASAQDPTVGVHAYWNATNIVCSIAASVASTLSAGAGNTTTTTSTTTTTTTTTSSSGTALDTNLCDRIPRSLWLTSEWRRRVLWPARQVALEPMRLKLPLFGPVDREAPFRGFVNRIIPMSVDRVQWLSLMSTVGTAYEAYNSTWLGNDLGDRVDTADASTQLSTSLAQTCIGLVCAQLVALRLSVSAGSSSGTSVAYSTALCDAAMKSSIEQLCTAQAGTWTDRIAKKTGATGASKEDLGNIDYEANLGGGEWNVDVLQSLSDTVRDTYLASIRGTNPTDPWYSIDDMLARQKTLDPVELTRAAERMESDVYIVGTAHVPRDAIVRVWSLWQLVGYFAYRDYVQYGLTSRSIHRVAPNPTCEGLDKPLWIEADLCPSGKGCDRSLLRTMDPDFQRLKNPVCVVPRCNKPWNRDLQWSQDGTRVFRTAAFPSDYVNAKSLANQFGRGMLEEPWSLPCSAQGVCTTETYMNQPYEARAGKCTCSEMSSIVVPKLVKNAWSVPLGHQNDACSFDAREQCYDSQESVGPCGTTAFQIFNAPRDVKGRCVVSIGSDGRQTTSCVCGNFPPSCTTPDLSCDRNAQMERDCEVCRSTVWASNSFTGPRCTSMPQGCVSPAYEIVPDYAAQNVSLRVVSSTEVSTSARPRSGWLQTYLPGDWVGCSQPPTMDAKTKASDRKKQCVELPVANTGDTPQWTCQCDAGWYGAWCQYPTLSWIDPARNPTMASLVSVSATVAETVSTSNTNANTFSTMAVTTGSDATTTSTLVRDSTPVYGCFNATNRSIRRKQCVWNVYTGAYDVLDDSTANALCSGSDTIAFDSASGAGWADTTADAYFESNSLRRWSVDAVPSVLGSVVPNEPAWLEAMVATNTYPTPRPNSLSSLSAASSDSSTSSSSTRTVQCIPCGGIECSGHGTCMHSDGRDEVSFLASTRDLVYWSSVASLFPSQSDTAHSRAVSSSSVLRASLHQQTCTCDNGWKGPYCSEPTCYPACVPGMGECQTRRVSTGGNLGGDQVQRTCKCIRFNDVNLVASGPQCQENRCAAVDPGGKPVPINIQGTQFRCNCSGTYYTPVPVRSGNAPLRYEWCSRRCDPPNILTAYSSDLAARECKAPPTAAPTIPPVTSTTPQPTTPSTYPPTTSSPFSTRPVTTTITTTSTPPPPRTVATPTTTKSPAMNSTNTTIYGNETEASPSAIASAATTASLDLTIDQAPGEMWNTVSIALTVAFSITFIGFVLMVYKNCQLSRKLAYARPGQIGLRR